MWEPGFDPDSNCKQKTPWERKNQNTDQALDRIKRIIANCVGYNDGMVRIQKNKKSLSEVF